MEALFFAFHFFTNLPLPFEAEWNEKTAAASLAWLPLTGLAKGFCLALLAVFFQNIGFPAGAALRAILLMAMELWVGGALFIDGFCDSCDGLFSRRDKSRTLEIMKDPGLGALGALGLMTAGLAKLLLLAELSTGGDFVRILLFYPCWSHWAVSFCACGFATAKEEGLAYFFKTGQKPLYIILGSLFVLAVIFLMPRYFPLACLGSLAAVVFCCLQVQSRLGGQTGDTYGLAAVCAELSFLLLAAFCGFLFNTYL